MKKYLFIFLTIIVYSSYSQTVIVSEKTISCSEQPYKLKKLQDIWLKNVQFQSSCSSITENSYNEITSAKYIRISRLTTASNDPGTHISGTTVHFALKAPYEPYIRAERELLNDYVPVLNDLHVLYNEEYLDNVPF